MADETSKTRIAIIGGSGLYELEGMVLKETLNIETPYGKPSSEIRIGEFEGKRVAFLARHGAGHKLNPTKVPYRANIYALKSIGVQQVLALTAVGSLKLEIKPCDFVIPDQLIDRTRLRENTFYDTIAVHVPFAEPFCREISRIYADAVKKVGVTVHTGGTYVCMEGPAFSTKAESQLYRSWGASVIGMTCIPEAKLAREAEMCYATLAASTDYDVWHDEPVTTEMVLTNFRKNLENIKKILCEAIRQVPEKSECSCQKSLQGTLITAQSAIDETDKEKYDLLLGKHWSI